MTPEPPLRARQLLIGAVIFFALDVGVEVTRWWSDRAEQNRRYAEAIATCANGGYFSIGRRVIACVVTDVTP